MNSPRYKLKLNIIENKFVPSKISVAKDNNPPKYMKERRLENTAAPLNDTKAKNVPITALITISGSTWKYKRVIGPASHPCKNPKANNPPSLNRSFIIPRENWIPKINAKERIRPIPFESGIIRNVEASMVMAVIAEVMERVV